MSQKPTIEVTYLLSDAGQRASLLEGGNGNARQCVQLAHGDHGFPLAVELAHIHYDGTGAVRCDLELLEGVSVKPILYDRPPAIETVLRDEMQRRLDHKTKADAHAAKKAAEVAAWCALPLEGRLEDRYNQWMPNRDDSAVRELPEYLEAKQEADRRNAERKVEKDRETAAAVAAKAAGVAALKAWALDRGSDLLKARIGGSFDWQSLAEQEFAETVMADHGYSKPIEDPFENFSVVVHPRTTPTMNEMEALRIAREKAEGSPMTAALVWVEYQSEDCPEKVSRCELELTVTCPTGRTIEGYFLPQ